MAIALAAALDFAARGQALEFAVSLLLAGVFLAVAVFVASLAVKPRYQPISLVMLINAASGLVAFMLIASGQVDPSSSVPVVGITGTVLLGMAGALFLELRKVRV